MSKKLYIKLFLMILFFSFFRTSFASDTPIEKVFKDIKTDYKYYNELQTLYDRGMIFPDENWNFNPQKLLNRDEFMWIMTEVTCTNCISPNTLYSLIEKYSNQEVFYDINNTNKYFYCIADAKTKWFVTWYQDWTKCEDWTWWKSLAPFCPNNTIILEEALAVILRASWILTNMEAELIRQKIRSGEIKSNLSEDVFPLNSDWSVYSFYPDFMKALDYELLEYDKNWTEKRYNLVQKVNNKLNPKKAITKEDFLYIAYVALKANSCIESKDSNLSLNMTFFPISCDEWKVNSCSPALLSWNSRVFDLFANVVIPDWDSISNDNQYIWRIYDNSSKYNLQNENQFYWKYVDSYNFWDWDYRVYLRVITDKWDTTEVYNDINFWWKSVSISKRWNYVVDFNGIVSWAKDSDSFIWNYWDWSTWYWKYTQHTYKKSWTYNVTLTVKDKDWKATTASMNHFTWNVENQWLDDYDSDWVLDKDDLCPSIPWPRSNKWCPVYNNSCSSDSDCPFGSYCSWWFCREKQSNSSCEYSWWDLIMWNVECKSCPCDKSIDFSTSIRKCDLVFPAITSPDGTNIYSRWNLFQIK